MLPVRVGLVFKTAISSTANCIDEECNPPSLTVEQQLGIQLARLFLTIKSHSDGWNAMAFLARVLPQFCYI